MAAGARAYRCDGQPAAGIIDRHVVQDGINEPEAPPRPACSGAGSARTP
jgi:hypothetical protein